MGVIALGLAYTGESTYTPDFMLAFSTWASTRLADVALAVAVIPPLIQGLVLIAVAALLAWLARAQPRRSPL